MPDLILITLWQDPYETQAGVLLGYVWSTVLCTTNGTQMVPKLLDKGWHSRTSKQIMLAPKVPL